MTHECCPEDHDALKSHFRDQKEATRPSEMFEHRRHPCILFHCNRTARSLHTRLHLHVEVKVFALSINCELWPMIQTRKPEQLCVGEGPLK